MNLSRLRDDLIIVCGFSQINARIAVDRFVNGNLPESQTKVIQYLMENPFNTPNFTTKGQTKQAAGAIEVLEHLNYSITQELDDDMS